MELQKDCYTGDWSSPLIDICLILVVGFVLLNTCVCLLGKLPVPPGRRLQEEQRKG